MVCTQVIGVAYPKTDSNLHKARTADALRVAFSMWVQAASTAYSGNR